MEAEGVRGRRRQTGAGKGEVELDRDVCRRYPVRFAVDIMIFLVLDRPAQTIFVIVVFVRGVDCQFGQTQIVVIRIIVVVGVRMRNPPQLLSPRVQSRARARRRIVEIDEIRLLRLSPRV